MNFIKLSLFALMTMTTACDSTKSAAADVTEPENASAEKATEMNEKLIAEGYKLGIIKHLPKSKCDYIVIDESTNARFDPINFNEEKFVDYKSDTLKIYYKARYLRMKNRCTEAQPIQLIDIKSR